MAALDLEGALRTYLRGVSAVSTLVGQRVLFGAPQDVAYPLVLVTRIGGGATGDADADGQAPMFQLDCIGPERDKATTWSVCAAVLDALTPLARDLVTLTGSIRMAGIVTDVRFVDPQQANIRPRYVITFRGVAWD